MALSVTLRAVAKLRARVTTIEKKSSEPYCARQTATLRQVCPTKSSPTDGSAWVVDLRPAEPLCRAAQGPGAAGISVQHHRFWHHRQITSKSGNKKWWIQCDCGSPPKQVLRTNLKLGNQRSCRACGPGKLRARCHSLKYYKLRAARGATKRKELTKPISHQLLRLRRK
jgi:hypothetical protein